MASTATIYDMFDPDERRTAVRRKVDQATTIRQSGVPLTVTLHDLSDTGAMIETAALLQSGITVTIGMPGLGRFDALIMNKTGPLYGCRFTIPLPAGGTEAAFGNDHIIPLPIASTDLRLSRDTRTSSDKWHGSARIALPVALSLSFWIGIAYAVRTMAAW